MIDTRLLPIKRVIAAESDYHPNEPAGSEFEPLVEVNAAFIDQRAAEVDAMASALDTSDSLWPNTPAVGVVKLLTAAIAKSKRPFAIFNKRTCPIIGGGGLGTLYVSVTKQGLAALRGVIRRIGGDRQISHLSTIESMRLYTPDDVVGDAGVRRLIDDPLGELGQIEPLLRFAVCHTARITGTRPTSKRRITGPQFQTDTLPES